MSIINHRISGVFLATLLMLTALLHPLPAVADEIYSANANGTASVINTADNSVTTFPLNVPLNANPSGMCLNPVTSHAYTVNTGANTISIIDTKSKTALATITDPRFTGLTTIACSPDGTVVLVANNAKDGLSSQLLYLDTATNSINPVSTPVDLNPASIVFNRNGSKIYVLSQDAPSITVIGMPERQTLSTTPLLNPDDVPFALAIHTQDTYLYVVNMVSNSVMFIDPATMATITTVNLPATSFNFPHTLTVSNSSDKVYVADYMDTISVIDPATKSVLTSFATPFPEALIEQNDGQKLYVSSESDATTDIIKSYATSSLAATPTDIPLPTGSAPKALATLSGTSHLLGLSQSGEGGGTVTWPYNQSYSSPTIPTVTYVRAPANISIATKALGDTCTNVRWFGCDSATDNGTHSASCLVNPLTVDRILYPEYFPSPHYPLDFPATSVNGVITCSDTSVCDGTTATCTFSPNTHYHIDSISIDGSPATIANPQGFTYTFNNISSAHSVSASFVIDTFSVSASAGSNGTITPAGATAVNYGANLSYTIVPDPNYHITDVLIDGTSVGPVISYTFSGVSAPHTISANFAIDTYTITASTGGNGTISPTGVTTINHGLDQSYTITPAVGYHIADVLIDGVSAGAITSYTFSTVKAPHTISATFAIDTFVISASVDGNGTISPSGATAVNYDFTQNYTITAATGYHVADVLVDGISVGVVTSYTFSNVKLPHTISATFAIDTFTITAATGINGTVSPTGTILTTYGQTATYVITPDTGYHIVNVVVDGTNAGSNSSYIFNNITAAHTISASFAIDTFSITPSVGSGGSITPAIPQSVPYNSNLQFDITPAYGYIITDVLIDGVSQGAPASYTFSNINATHTIEARFADPTPPDINLTSTIIPDAPTNLADATFTFTSSDPTASFECSLDNSGFNSCASPLNYNGLSDGTHLFSVRAKDAADNMLPPNTVSWLVDTTPPLDCVATAMPGNNKIVLACPSAVDSTAFTKDVSGIAYYIFRTGMPGTPLPDKCIDGNVLNLSTGYVTGLINDITYDFRICAVDVAGNVSPGSNVVSATPRKSFITVSPDAIDFGTMTFNNDSLVTTVIITNTSTLGAIGINNVKIAGINSDNFTVVPGGSCGSYPFSIAATEHCTLNVIFRPIIVANGSSYAILSVTTDEANAPTTSSTLSGTATFNFTSSASSNGLISPFGTTAVNDGASQSYTITPDVDFHVVDVLVDGTSVGAISSYTFKSVAAPHTISATFAANTFTISADTDGNGTISPSGSTTITSGANQSYSITPNAGYHISSILVDGVSVGAVSSYTFTNISAAHSIRATFAINSYPISVMIIGSGTVTPPSTPLTYGSSRSYTMTPNTGYHVTTILVDNVNIGAVSNYTFNTVTAPHSLTVTFDINTYEITASANSGGSITPTTSASYQSSKTYFITPATGYHITDVLVDGASVGVISSYTFTTVTAPHTISATFTVDTFTITASAGAHGTVSPAGSATVAYGTTPSYTITPDSGYHVTGVLVDNVSVGAVTSYPFKAVIASHTISATFAINTFTISATASAGGTISPTTSVNYQDNKTFTITPATGYHISDVKVDGLSVGATNSYTFTSVTTPHTITADFASDSFTITASADPHGTISPAGATSASYGASRSYSITPDAGYHIGSVLVDGVNTGAISSYAFNAVTAAHTINATFAIDTVTITASTTPGGSVTSPAPVPYGSSQLIVLTPNVGYYLAELTDNGTNVLTAVTNKTQYTIATVTTPHTIHATFSPYTLVDALQALRVAVGMSLAKPEEMIRLDVAPLDLGKPKGDGAITIQDAYILLRRQIGLYSF